MKLDVQTRVKTRIVDAATGIVLRESPWQKNLVMDNGLNALAGSTNSVRIADFTKACRIGSGTTPNSYASGAITFTQAGTTLTASAGFFTAGMVGMLFKWGSGSGGNERYITAFTSTTQVTLDTSETVGTPAVGTVWAVNQSTMAALLYSSASYETTAGSCESTFSTNVATHKRTFNFAQQVASYNVNEIGYFSGTGGTTVFGRLVLSSTDVVPPTSFYQVVLSVQFTFSPGTPTAVANVGTNIDTAGNAMCECINSANAWSQVQSSGASTGAGGLDNAPFIPSTFALITATYSQNANTGAAVAVTRQVVASLSAWTFSGTRGKRTVSFNTTITTAGETLYGVCLTNSGNASSLFDVKFTSTYALPTGSFLPQATFAITFDRTLTN